MAHLSAYMPIIHLRRNKCIKKKGVQPRAKERQGLDYTRPPSVFPTHDRCRLFMISFRDFPNIAIIFCPPFFFWSTSIHLIYMVFLKSRTSCSLSLRETKCPPAAMGQASSIHRSWPSFPGVLWFSIVLRYDITIIFGETLCKAFNDRFVGVGSFVL